MQRELASSLIFVTIVLSGCDKSGGDNPVVGQLESDRVELTADYAEPILERLVREGDSVSAGQVLLRQDTSRIETQIAEAHAVLEQSRARHDELTRGPRKEQIQAERASVSGAERELDFRRIEYDRALKVKQLELASPEAVDRAKARLDASNATLEMHEARLDELLTGTTVEELRQAESVVMQAEARVSALEVEQSRHQFTAPVDGIVDSILFETGERPGVSQPAIIILTGSQPFARVYVPENIRVQVSPGTAARIFVDGLAESLTGRVRWIASDAAFTPYFALTEHDRGRLTYFAKIDIVDERDRLPDGVPVQVEFALATGTD